MYVRRLRLWMRWKWIIACTCLLASSYTQAVALATTACVRIDPLCGPRSLSVVCQRMGVPATLDEVTALSGYVEKSGTSLLGLLKACEAKGLKATAMKLGMADLYAFKGPAVACLWNNHFVLVEPGAEGMLKLSDPPTEPIYIKPEDFQKVYSGFALLVAKDASAFPKPKPEGADARFDAYNWDFAAVNEGDSPDHTFKCRNVGNADLVISKVESSCADCLVATNGPQTIKPGGEGEIKIFALTAKQRRGVSKTLYVHCNDPISPIVHLNVTGYVRPAQLLFSPTSVSFGRQRRSESATTNPDQPVIRVPLYAYVEQKQGYQSTFSGRPIFTSTAP